MKYIQINRWDEMQHYKDRHPPWIKLYNDLPRRHDYSCLQDDSKLVLISLFLLASCNDNKIPYDLKWIQDEMKLQKKIQTRVVDELVSLGWISVYDGDSNMIAPCKQSACPETETEREGEKRQNIPQEEFVTYWNSKKKLPRITTFTKSRQSSLRVRSKEDVFRLRWREVIDNLAASKFHTGDGGRGWRAKVDWILKNDSNYVKMLENSRPKTAPETCCMCPNPWTMELMNKKYCPECNPNRIGERHERTGKTTSPHRAEPG